MDMGTGKTPTILWDIQDKYERGLITRAIIFVPKTIINDWISQVHKFLTCNYVVATIDGNKKKRLKSFDEFKKIDPSFYTVKELKKLGYEGKTKAEMISNVKLPLQILITNYEKGRVMTPDLKRFKPQFAVVDESHKIKNRNAALSKAVYAIAACADYKRIMTGTPITNSVEDLFMQFKFLGLWNNFKQEFKPYLKYGGFLGKQVMGFIDDDKIKKELKPYIYRVKIEDCIDLPDRLPDLNLHCSLGKESQKVYNQMNSDDMRVVLERVQESWPRKKLKKVLREHDIPYGSSEDYLTLFYRAKDFVDTSSVELIVNKTMRLQQITGGFLTMNSGEIVQVGKEKLNMLIDYLMSYDKPVIVSCLYKAEIKMLEEELTNVKRNGKKLKIGVISGGRKDRGDVVKQFQNNKLDVLISQCSVGSVGLNLQNACRLIFYSWSPKYDDYDQMVARIKRSGQKNVYRVIHLIAEGTIDEKLIALIQSKRKRFKNFF